MSARTASILVGGAAGTLTRAAVAELLPPGPGGWPWATFAVNVAGTVALAWVTARLVGATGPARHLRHLLGTGFCGALTTFSTFQVETIRLADDGHAALAAGYATASIAVGMAAAAGATLAARRRGRR